MSLTKNLHPDEKYKAGKLGTQMMLAGTALVAVMGILSLILGAVHGDNFKRFLYAYVTGWMFAVSLSIGMMWLVLLHHLTRSRWSVVVRRIAEAITGAFPVLWVAGLAFILPVLFGYKDLYYWAHPGARENPDLIHKLGWLSPGMFTLRYVVYGAIFIGMSSYFSKKSREQDESGDPKISVTLRRASGPGMILFSLTTVMLAFDIMMSLAPSWYSTIYGVMFWGSSNVGAFAALGLIVLWLQRNGRLVHSVNEEHYHDIGKWMFSFTFFWAYTAFSQFMLQWYGNMPEETNWYKYRMFGDWQWVSIAILVGYWAFPFVFLMSRWTKRIVPSLVFFSVWQLVFHWLDMYWDVMPQYDWTTVTRGATSVNAGPLSGPIALHHVGFSPLDITVWLALVGFFLIGVARGLKGNLIPIKDPVLGLSLAHEQL